MATHKKIGLSLLKTYDTTFSCQTMGNELTASWVYGSLGITFDLSVSQKLRSIDVFYPTKSNLISIHGACCNEFSLSFTI